MRLRIAKIFIDEEANDNGFIVKELDNGVELFNSENDLKAEIKEEFLEINTKGLMEARIERDGKSAVLPKKSRGKIFPEDKIWLLNNEASLSFKKNGEEQKGAVVKVLAVEEEIKDEEKDKIYIKEKGNFLEKNNRNFNVILGAIIFLLLIGGTVLGYQKKSDSESLKKINELKENWQKEKGEIESVRSINPETALTITQKAEEEIKAAGSINKKYDSEIEKIKDEIKEIKTGLGAKGTEYEIAYDTTLISESGEYGAMAIKDSSLYLWNQKEGRVDMVDINLKSNEKLVSDEKIKKWLGIFNSSDKWYGYDQNKIYEIKRKQLIETEISKIRAINQATAWNGIIYIVDNEEKMVDKIANNEGQKWLKNDLNLEEEVGGICIDTNVWILGKSGKIYGYSRGEKTEYNMSFSSQLKEAKSLVCNDKVNFLAYVGDGNTVIIYGKDGKILGKYNFDNQKIVDIGIENQNKAVLVLSDNGKIYRIKIK